MGWVVLVAAVPLFERMSAAGLAWLVLGGLCYTAGAVVFLLDSRLRYAHFVWHLLVHRRQRLPLLRGAVARPVRATHQVPSQAVDRGSGLPAQ